MAKFTCRVIQDTNGKYHADLCVSGRIVEGLPSDVDYNTLREAVRNSTGIEIPKRSNMIFERYNGKSYAMIDATQARKDCRVTIEEILNGWKPDFSVSDELELNEHDNAVIAAVEGALCLYRSEDIYVFADNQCSKMINVCSYEDGEWMSDVASIFDCNIPALKEAMYYRGVACEF